MDRLDLQQAVAAGQVVFTEHALSQMRKRQLDEAQVRGVLTNPEDVLPVREGRIVAQAIVGAHLWRVFVDVDRHPIEVVTVYKTSRIDDYRSHP